MIRTFICMSVACGLAVAGIGKGRAESLETGPLVLSDAPLPVGGPPPVDPPVEVRSSKSGPLPISPAPKTFTPANESYRPHEGPLQEGPSPLDPGGPPLVDLGPGVLPAGPPEAHAEAQNGHGVSVGGGVYLMQPSWESNPAFHVTTVSKTKGFSVFTRTYEDFRYDLHAAPLLWVGFYNENGFGARVRWFMFQDGSEADTVVPKGGTVRTARPLGLDLVSDVPGDTFHFSSHLRLYVWDFEGTRSWNGDNWQIQGAAGVRYAHLSQDYLATVRPGPGSATEPNDLSFSRNFNGAGPTLAVEGKYRLGCTNFALYGNGRGAILFGSGKDELFKKEPTSFHDHTRHQADVVPMSELEIGAQYTACLRRSVLFFQTGFVGQVWWGVGNASNHDRVDVTNLGFVGLVMRAGVNF